MEIRINITKTSLVVLIAAILVFGSALIVVAYNVIPSWPNTASNVGHSVDEIDWAAPIEENVDIQGRLDVENVSVGVKLEVNGLTSCDSIDTDSSGRVVCGTDQGYTSCVLNCINQASCSGGRVFTGIGGASGSRCCRIDCS